MKQLYRDPQNGLILGICAGFARSFEIPVVWLRIALVFALLIFPFTFLFYFLAAFIIRKDPAPAQQARRSKEDFLSELENLRNALEKSKKRIVQLEDYVTSDEFEWRRRLLSTNEASHSSSSGELKSKSGF